MLKLDDVTSFHPNGIILSPEPRVGSYGRLRMGQTWADSGFWEEVEKLRPHWFSRKVARVIQGDRGDWAEELAQVQTYHLRHVVRNLHGSLQTATVESRLASRFQHVIFEGFVPPTCLSSTFVLSGVSVNRDRGVLASQVEGLTLFMTRKPHISARRHERSEKDVRWHLKQCHC